VKARIEFEMPPSCAYCPLCHKATEDFFYYCAIATVDYWEISTKARPEECPLEEVKDE